MIRFSDINNGYLIGNVISFTQIGVIFRTTDGGQSWQQQLADASAILNNLSIINGSQAYVCGTNFKLLNTTNQGTDWNAVSGFIGGNTDAHFPSSRTGYMIAYNANAGQYLNKTTSFGHIWNAVKLREADEPKLKAVWFADSLSGYLAGEQGNIIMTTNGGESWQTQRAGQNDTIERLHFLSASLGFAIGGTAGSGLLLGTTDAGQSWLPQSLPVSDKQLLGIWFVNNTTGYISGQNGLILKTTDAGQSWNILASGASITLNSIWFRDLNNGFAVGKGGAVLRTTNAGSSWSGRIVDAGTEFLDIKAVNNMLYAAGRKNAPLLGYYDAAMYTSTNMGTIWLPATTINSFFSYYTRIHVKSDKQAYLLTNFARFFEINSVGTSVFRPKNSNRAALSFDIYPNPSIDGSSTISHRYSGKVHISITSIQGRPIAQITTEKQEVNVKLTRGLYFVRLENHWGSRVQKLVVY